MNVLKKFLSVMLSLVLVITSVVTVLPISYAESSSNNNVSNDILDIPEDEFDIDKNLEDYYENLNELIPGEDYIEGEMIVKYSPTNNSQSLDDIAEEFDLTLECNLGEPNTFNTLSVDEHTNDEGLYILSFDEEISVVDIVQEISEFEEVEYAQPNYIYETCEISSNYITIDNEDEKNIESQQTMMNSLNMGSTNLTGEGIVVAVIDSGIDLSHTALKNCFWNNNGIVGYNTADPANPTPITLDDDTIYNGNHGTHVAGIIAMQQTSDDACKGIAPGVQIMDLQAVLPNGKFNTATVAAAIELAIEHEADIINLSLGGENFDPTLNLMCNQAARKAVLVAAAGNDGIDRKKSFPAMFKSVIGVMAYGGSALASDYTENINDNTTFLNANYPEDGLMTLADFSNFDSQEKYYDIIAPGVNICSTTVRTTDSETGSVLSNSEYVFMSGTSMASPIVAGVAALYLQKNPEATPGQVRAALSQPSDKKVKKFEYLNEKENINSTKLLSNQIDVSHILSVIPNEEIDSPYIFPTDVSNNNLNDFVEYIRLQFNNDIEDNEIITNEDIRIISFLNFTSTQNIAHCSELLSEFYNLLGIRFEGPEISDFDVELVFYNNNFENLEFLMLSETQVSNLDIPTTFCPNIFEIDAVSNTNLRNVSSLQAFSKLAYIRMQDCNISNIDFLSYASNIKEICFNYNHIINIEPLATLSNIQYISMIGNHIVDISPLYNCKYIVGIDFRDNLINSIGDTLLLSTLIKVDLRENLLRNQMQAIENAFADKETVNNEWLLVSLSPFKEVTEPQKIVGYDMCIKRSDQNVLPSIVVFPDNATCNHIINLSSNSNIISINNSSKNISYNKEYQSEETSLFLNSALFYEYEGSEYSLDGSIDVSFIMPAIESVSLEKYNFDNSNSENYLSLITTIDTTKIKIELDSNEVIEYNLFDHNVDYKDYENERVIKILLDNNYDIDNQIIVSTGDCIGYYDSKVVNNTNTINIDVEQENITQIYGNAEKLFLEDSRISGVMTAAISSSSNIGTLVLADNILNISPSSFQNSSISQLYIKNKCENLTQNIFYNCDNMLVFVDEESPIKNFTGATINSDYIYSYDDNGILTLIEYRGTETNVIIPSYLEIQKIGEGAFVSNIAIESINIPKTVTIIGDHAFDGCTNLSNIGGILDVTSIGAYAFHKTGLTNICIHLKKNDITSTSIFEECENLETVKIYTNKISYLTSKEFKGCENLICFSIDSTEPIYVSTSCFEDCKKLSSFDTINRNVSISGDKAFKNCYNLSGEIYVRSDTVGEEVFYNCKSISSVHCVNTVTIESNAFYGTETLSEIGLVGNNNSCANNAFEESNENLTIYSNGAVNGLDSSNNNIKICTDYSLRTKSNGNIILQAYLGSATDVKIPQCLKIHEINSGVFKENTTIKTVHIPSSVKNIGESAFESCPDLKEILGAYNVTDIGPFAFSNCPKLEKVPLMQTLKNIEDYAFSSTALTEFKITGNVEYCGTGVFSDCDSLKNIEIAGNLWVVPSNFLYSCDNLERCVLNNRCFIIDSYAFRNCNNLTQLYIPRSVTRLYRTSTSTTTKLYCEVNAPFISTLPTNLKNEIYPHYEVVNGVLLDYQSETGYDYVDDNGKRVVEIPNTVRQVSDWVFFGNQNVDKVITSDYLYVIGEYAFMDCSVTEILMPPKMSHIGRSAFNRTGITSIDIPDGITKLEPFFMHCAPIQQVTIPESVTEICNDAFGDCQNLQSVYIPGNINSIDPNAFAGAYKPITLWGNDNSYLIQYANDNSLQNDNNVIVCRLGFNIAGDALNGYTGNDINVQVPTYMQLNSIGDAAFKNNTTVESISIASGISNIGSECFSGCTSLNSLLIPDDVVCVGENAFYGIPNLTIYCNEGSYIEGYCIENNINVNTDYDISDGVLNAYNGTATNLVIPSNWFITSIGEYAFDSNTNITSVTIPEGVREIGASAFGGCSALTTVVLPASNGIKLSAVAFIDCINLTDIVNSTSITRVGNSAFGYCTSLESIDLSNVETIAAYGFDFCPSLSNVILGTSVTNIWRNAFTDCENLVINCYSNTYAHQYAIDHDIPYVLLDEITISGFSLRRSFESNATNSNSLEALEERTIPSLEDKIDDYIQQECNGKVTRDNLDDIIAYITVNSGDNHLI